MAAKKCIICNCSLTGRRDAKTCGPRCRKRLQLVRHSFGAQATTQYSKQISVTRISRPLKKALIVLIFGIVGILSILFSFSVPKTQAAPSSLLNYQMRLLTSSGSVVADGTYNVEFKLYNSANSTGSSQGSCSGDANCLWVESYTSGNKIRVVNGYMSAKLGTLTTLSSLNWDQDLWLGVRIGGSGAPGWETIELTSDGTATGNKIQLTQVPNAFNSQKLQGLAASGFIQNTVSPQATSNFNISGTGWAPSFDAPSSNGTLGLGATNAGAITIGNTTNTSVVIKTKQVASAFQVQNASGNEILTIDTSATAANNLVKFGKASTLDGKIVFNTSAGTNTATITLAANPTNSYTYQLPTGTIATGECIKVGTVSGGNVPLTSGSCGGGGTLATTYTAGANSTDQTLLLTNADGGGVIIKDDVTPITGSLFNVQSNGGANFLDTTSSTLSLGALAAAYTIQIGTTTAQGAGGTTQSINIGNSNTTGTQNVTIGTGSGATAGNTTIQAKGILALGNTSTPTIQIQGSSGGTISIGDNAVNKTITIGPTGAVNNTTTLHLADTTSSGGAQTITIGGTGANNGSNTSTTIKAQAGQTYLGLANSGATLQTFSDSTTAFQIQNASSVTELAFDTISSNLTQTAVTPTYKSGIDQGSGTASTASVRDINVVGNLAFTVQGSSGASDCATNREACEFQIYDITNPSSVAALGKANASATGTQSVQFNQVKVVGKYAYIVSNGSGGTCTLASWFGCTFMIWDISNPASPTLVGATNDSGIANTGLIAVDVVGRYAYVTNQGNSSSSCSSGQLSYCELKVIDIADPTTPLIIGGTDSAGAGSGAVQFNDVKVVGKYAYVVKNGSAGTCSATSRDGCEFMIFDISNPYTPVYLNGIDGGAGSSTIAMNHVVVSGRYAYISRTGSAVANCSSQDGCEIQIYDISNPTSITYVSGIDSTNAGTGSDTANNLIINGRYLYYVKSNNAGTCSTSTRDGCEMQMWDLNTISSPSYVGGIDATSTISYQSLTTAGRYIYLGASNNATSCTTVSDRAGCELQVYDLSGIETNSLNAGSISTNQLTVKDTASFTQNVRIAGMLGVGAGLNVQGAANFSGEVKIMGSQIITQTQYDPTLLKINETSAVGYSVLTVSNSNLLQYGDFETALAGYWLNRNPSSAAAGVCNFNRFVFGSCSANVGGSSLANEGIYQLFTFKPGTSYTLSVYARGNGLSASDFELGHSETAAGGDINSGCTGLSIANSVTWTRYTCTFTTGTSFQAANSYVYFKHTNAVLVNFLLDGAQLVEGFSAIPFNIGSTTHNSDTKIQTIYNSTTAFQVQNATSNNIVTVDTTNSATTLGSSLTVQNPISSTAFLSVASTTFNNLNLISNPGFEIGTYGWTKYSNNETTFTAQTPTTTFYAYSGALMLQIITPATATNDGAKFPYYFKPNTQYTFQVAGMGSATVAKFDLGANVNGGDLGSCNNRTINNQAWSTYSCTFTTGATVTGTDYLFLRRNSTDSATARTWYFDSAQLVYGSSTTTMVDQPTINLASNSNFENNINGWAAKGSATLSVSSDYSNFGNQSLKVVTSAAGNGAAYSYQPVAINTNYVYSFYARVASGSQTYTIGRQDISGTDVDAECAPLATVTITTTWTQFTCAYASGATITPPSTLYIKQSGAGTPTLYIDGFTLVLGGTALAYTQPANNLQIDPQYNNISLNNTNTAEIQPWQNSGNLLPAARNGAGTLIANGYMYIIGGGSSGSNTIYYSKLNTDGSPNAFSTNTNTLPANRKYAASSVSNGYLYVIGGSTDGTNANAQTTTYYAKLNQDGSIGAFNATSALSTATHQGGSIAVNGYIYFIGGANTSGTAQSTVYYAKQNSDGSLGSWTTTNSITAKLGPAVTNASGYLYVLGGGASGSNTVQYARINADGSLGSFTTNANNLAGNRGFAGAVAANGYLYLIGGTSGTVSNNVSFAKQNADGSTGLWKVSLNNLPLARSEFQAVSSNGYIYVAGGTDGSTVQNTIYYTSTSRILIGGSIDLVGLGGQNISDNGGMGGTLTAGNTKVVGSLEVQDQTQFNSNVGISGTLSISGSAQIKASQNTTNIFQVQNASGVNLINVNTVNLVGNSDFETGTPNTTQIPDGWTAKGTATISVDNAQFLYGGQSMKVVTNASGNTGAQFSFPFLPSTQYTLSAYIRGNAAYTDINLERQETGSDLTTGTGNCTALSVNTNWTTRYSCTFTTGSTIGVSNIFIKNTTAASETFWVDGIQLETAGAATTYREGDLRFDGQVTIKNTADSTTAFQIQNAAATSLFKVDTSGSVITISGTTSAFVNLTISEAHVKSIQTTAPTIGTPSTCGTSPTAALGTGSTDVAGSFRITSGTGGGYTTCDTVLTFNKAYGTAPKSIIITPETKDGGSGTAFDRKITVSNSSTTTFTVKFYSNPAGDSEINWYYYWIIE